MKKIGLRILLGLGTIVIAILLFFVITNCIVLLSTQKRILTLSNLSDIEEYKDAFDVIVVLGASVKPDGTPSDMLRDRIEVGNELYFAGYAGKILMSGDHMTTDYDEVGNMKRYAIAAGVAAEAIYLDHAGLSTYDSMWRLAHIFKAKKVLIVTQSYHLHRSLYLAKSFGIDAFGVSADLRPYRGQLYRDVREILARGKDLVLSVLKPQATHIGPTVSLEESGSYTDQNPFWKEEENT